MNIQPGTERVSLERLNAMRDQAQVLYGQTFEATALGRQEQSFLDSEPWQTEQLRYYRIRTQDYDGTIRYSYLIEARPSTMAPVTSLRTWPNPVADQLQFWGIAGELRVFHLAGQELLRDQSQSESQQLDVSQWVPGIYTITITSPEGFVQTGRFVKQ
jgi:hypothetical protein